MCRKSSGATLLGGDAAPMARELPRAGAATGAMAQATRGRDSLAQEMVANQGRRSRGPARRENRREPAYHQERDECEWAVHVESPLAAGMQH